LIRFLNHIKYLWDFEIQTIVKIDWDMPSLDKILRVHEIMHACLKLDLAPVKC